MDHDPSSRDGGGFSGSEKYEKSTDTTCEQPRLMTADQASASNWTGMFRLPLSLGSMPMWHISFTLADTNNIYLREFWTTNVVVSNSWILGFNTSFAKLSFWPVEKLSLNGNPLDYQFAVEDTI
jgi:hypothetical protein